MLHKSTQPLIPFCTCAATTRRRRWWCGKKKEGTYPKTIFCSKRTLFLCVSVWSGFFSEQSEFWYGVRKWCYFSEGPSYVAQLSLNDHKLLGKSSWFQFYDELFTIKLSKRECLFPVNSVLHCSKNLTSSTCERARTRFGKAVDMHVHSLSVGVLST